MMEAAGAAVFASEGRRTEVEGVVAVVDTRLEAAAAALVEAGRMAFAIVRIVPVEQGFENVAACTFLLGSRVECDDDLSMHSHTQ